MLSMFSLLIGAGLLLATTIFEVAMHLIRRSEYASPIGIAGLIGRRVIAKTDLNPTGKVIVRGNILRVLETIYNPPDCDLEDTSSMPFSFWGRLSSSEPGAFGRTIIGGDWLARSQGETIRDGEAVEIIGVDGLSLIVRHE